MKKALPQILMWQPTAIVALIVSCLTDGSAFAQRGGGGIGSNSGAFRGGGPVLVARGPMLVAKGRRLKLVMAPRWSFQQLFAPSGVRVTTWPTLIGEALTLSCFGLLR